MMHGFSFSQGTHRVGLHTLLAAGLSALLLMGCSSGPLRKPSIEVAEVRVADFDRESVKFTVTLRVDNPNPIDITINDIQARFYLADQETGKVESVQPKYTLPASAAVMLPLRVTITLKELPDTMKRSALSLIGGDLPYAITGTVTTLNGLSTVSFEKSGNIAKRR